jgi:hypothetical protein
MGQLRKTFLVTLKVACAIWNRGPGFKNLIQFLRWAGEWRPGSVGAGHLARKGFNAVPFRRILVISIMLVFSLDLHHVPNSCVSRYLSSAFSTVT